MQEYPFIMEIEGEVYLEPENYDDRRVELAEIFELYTTPSIDKQDVARFVGVEEKDVTNAVYYWTEEPGVYEELVEEANLGSDSEIFSDNNCEDGKQSSASNLPAKKGGYSDQDDLGRQKVYNPVNPLHLASNTFLDLRNKDRTLITEQNIFDDPDESYIDDEIMESHVRWERNGSSLGLYAGWDMDEGNNIGYLTYSVDGETGELLVVEGEMDSDEADPIEKMIKQLYNNAVFESM